MKGDLKREDLDFLQEAIVAFERDHRLFTFTNQNEDLIALRYGADHDCIKVVELGEEKAFFHNIMKKCPVKTVKKDEADSTKMEKGVVYFTGLGETLDGKSMKIEFKAMSQNVEVEESCCSSFPEIRPTKITILPMTDNQKETVRLTVEENK